MSHLLTWCPVFLQNVLIDRKKWHRSKKRSVAPLRGGAAGSFGAGDGVIVPRQQRTHQEDMTQDPHLVTRDRHGAKKWLRHKGFGFAAAMNVLPIAAAELSHAARALPIAFISEGGKTVPVVILGLQPGQNYFVAPDGRWVGLYTPAALRGYPFRLGRTNAAGDNNF